MLALLVQEHVASSIKQAVESIEKGPVDVRVQARGVVQVQQERAKFKSTFQLDMLDKARLRIEISVDMAERNRHT